MAAVKPAGPAPTTTMSYIILFPFLPIGKVIFPEGEAFSQEVKTGVSLDTPEPLYALAAVSIYLRMLERLTYCSIFPFLTTTSVGA